MTAGAGWGPWRWSSPPGFLFAMKRVKPLVQVRVEADCPRPFLLFHDYPEPGQCGEFRGEAEVLIRRETGEVLARRDQPRTRFGGLRRQFFWDHLDFLYFAGYATWNYLMTPFLFSSGRGSASKRHRPGRMPGG